MRIIDLFAGVGGIRQGFEKYFGNDFVFSSEIDKFAQKAYEENYKQKPHGDITKIKPEDIPEFDILLGGFPCFTAGHKVLTKEGYKNIEDIKKRDMVLTHKNRYKKVVIPMKKKSNHIYKIKIENIDKELEVTSEHPFYTLKKNSLNKEPEWIETKNLNKEKDLLLSFNKNELNYHKIESINYEEKEIWVYNFEVEEDNSYTVENIIVHNCQPFSNAGKKLGFEDTRGTLFFNIAEILKYHKPQIFFLENVKGFKSHDKGNTYKTVIKTLNEIGYKIHTEILNAKDFGLPQNRERIFLVGFLDHSIDFEFPKKLDKKTRLGDILFDEVDEKYTISDKLWEGHQRRKQEHKRKGNGFGYKIFDENSEYTSTLSARYYKDGSEILIYQDDKNPRKLTPREAGRLQGFPDSFKIVVSDTQAYKQFGNSVSVPVIEHIAKSIRDSINKS